MRFEKFEIENFKGIETAELSLTPRGAGIFTLIGLNESGKTTILEALNAWDFAEDKHSALYSSQRLRRDRTSFVPKQKKSNFSGLVKIVGHVRITDAEKEEIALKVEVECKCVVERKSIPEAFRITRGFRFANSDFATVQGGINVSAIMTFTNHGILG